MKIREAKVYVINTGSFRPVVVELLTDEGLSGIGEAAVGFGVGCKAAAAMIAELAEAFVIGRDPAQIRSIWNDFYYQTFWGKGAGAIFYAAVSALEIALWDIKGKSLNTPVYNLLGGAQRQEIPVYANDWSFGHSTPQEFAARAAEVVADGFDAIKMYPLSINDTRHSINGHLKNRYVDGQMLRQAVQNVQAVREAVGPEVALMVDVTAEGTTDTMTQLAQEIAAYDIYFYEEPLDAFDIAACRELKTRTSLTIATGERLYTRNGFRRLFELRAADIVQPDPGTCGGIEEVYHIGAMAEAYNMRIAPHNCGGPVLTAAAVQLSACLGNLVMLETFPYRPELHYNIVEQAYEKRIVQGRLPVPQEPGLGVSLNQAVVQPFLAYRLT